MFLLHFFHMIAPGYLILPDQGFYNPIAPLSIPKWNAQLLPRAPYCIFSSFKEKALIWPPGGAKTTTQTFTII